MNSTSTPLSFLYCINIGALGEIKGLGYISHELEKHPWVDLGYT